VKELPLFEIHEAAGFLAAMLVYCSLANIAIALSTWQCNHNGGNDGSGSRARNQRSWLSQQLLCAPWSRSPATFHFKAKRNWRLWQKLHSHVYTHATVCSFVSFTHYLIYLRRWIAKKICLWHCLFASFISLSQLIIVIWIKTSVGTITVFHKGISRAVAVA
jgi:hypothetical protein